jgi:hypothetical protein
VLEPLIGLSVDVRCESAPRFVRSYQLFVDPPTHLPAVQPDGPRVTVAAASTPLDVASPRADGRAAAASPPMAPSVATASTAAASPPRASVSARARGQTGDVLAQGQTYLVVRGDTLSGIAARIGDRPGTIREAAEAIFAANPAAFTRANPDLIKAGGTITIPIMAAAPVAAPAPAVADATPAARAAEGLSSATPAASELAPATNEAPGTSQAPAASETLAARADAAVEAVEPVEPQLAVPAAGTASAPASHAEPASAENGTVTSGRASGWLTALLALGAVVVLSVPLLLVRRRKRHAPPDDAATQRVSRPRRLVDPVAGIDVVEGHLPDEPTSSPTPAAAARTKTAPLTPTPADFSLDIGSVDSVDLDVGAPLVAEERVDWFGDRAAAAAIASSPTTNAALENLAPENAPTARLPELDREHIATAETQAAVRPPPIDDEQHTLTIAELDVLRQDYETEHTLTQAGSKALRDAVAELKAAQPARAANADTATLEMPQQTDAEALESQPTQRLRSSR